jgi:hypothetical protein
MSIRPHSLSASAYMPQCALNVLCKSCPSQVAFAMARQGILPTCCQISPALVFIAESYSLRPLASPLQACRPSKLTGSAIDSEERPLIELLQFDGNNGVNLWSVYQLVTDFA